MITKKVVVSGHICLDITPDFSSLPNGQFKTLLQPGRTIKMRGVSMSAGGAVSNTGLSLHRLGVPTTLIGKIGDDLFGRQVSEIIGQEDPGLVTDLVVDPGTPTGFTFIINPPGFDRTFLSLHGANDTFYASDLPRNTLQRADLFHFGYPSLMRSIYRGEGGELVSILMRARRAGLTTSLDFSFPDPTSPAGKVDWPLVLANSLPLVDLFVPSALELTFLLKRETFDELSADPDTAVEDAVTPALLDEMSEIVLGYGVKAVMIKCGHRGIYLRTNTAKAFSKSGRGLMGIGEDWFERTLWAPAFEVDVVGTTGAGDAAIAGFLASVLNGSSPETALLMAAAAGACSVETSTPAGGLSSWEAVLLRIKQGWKTLPLDLADDGWEKDETHGIWYKA